MPTERPSFSEGGKATRSLSEAQHGAQRFLLQEIADSSPNDKTILLLRGLPGVGKSTVTDTIKQTKSVRVAPDATLLQYDEGLRERTFNIPGTIIMSAIPSEEAEIRRQYGSTHEIKDNIMKGMTEAEMRAFLEKNLRGQEPTVPLSQLVSFTMGVPRLGKLLTIRPELTERITRETAGKYHRALDIFFPRDNSDNFSEYLNIPPSPAVIAAGREIKWNGAVDLSRVLEQQLAFQEKYGIEEFSPEFVDPITTRIYEQAAENGRARRTNPQISILAPEVPPEIYGQIEASLGIALDNPLFSRWPATELIARSKRSQIFRAEDAKVAVLVKHPSGKKIGELPFYNDDKRLNEIATQIPQLNTKTTDERHARFFVQGRNHDALYPSVIVFGHMVESLLQQVGASYVVDNQLAGEKYWFNGQTKKLTVF